MTALDRDPFALARRDDDDDAEILALFRRWCAEMRSESARPADEDFDHDGVIALAEEIFEAAANGPVGLAIKAFMLAYEVCEMDGLTTYRKGQDACIIGRFKPTDQPCSAPRSAAGHGRASPAPTRRPASPGCRAAALDCVCGDLTRLEGHRARRPAR